MSEKFIGGIEDLFVFDIRRGDFLRALAMPKAIVVAPTNGVVGKTGLVMGAGAAK